MAKINGKTVMLNANLGDIIHVDSTLTQPSMAADAKKVGDALAKIEENNTVMGARLNELIEGETPEDAEIIDVRVDVFGNTHATAGEAVRSQINNLLTANENVEYTTVTRKLNISGSGITAVYDNGKVKLYGTSTAARSLVCLNNQIGIITSSTAFSRTLPAGRYKVNISSAGAVDTINYVRCSYSTLANQFTVQNGEIVDFTNDVMIALPIPNHTSFGTEEAPTTISVAITKLEPIAYKPLNILFIGNSYTQDVCAYIPALMKDIAPNIQLHIGVCYTASATIGQHTTWLDNDTPYTVFNNWIKTAAVWRRDSSGGTVDRSTTLREALTTYNWDIIVLQSVADESQDEQSRNGIISRARILMSKIKPLVKNSCKFAFMVPSARAYTKGGVDYDIDTVYENSIELDKAVNKNLGIDFSFPVATAIQNARSNATFDVMGADSNHAMMYDGKHLQAGLPALIGAYTIIETLLRNTYKEYGINGDYWIPTLQNSLDINATELSGGEYLGMVHGSPEGVTNDEYIRAAQEIAIIACNNPYELTDCSNIIIDS